MSKGLNQMTEHTKHYAPQFKAWAVKTHGPRPTEVQLEQAHMLGCKPGKQALAVAMGLRDEGVTNPQVLHACGNPQNNKRAGLVTDSYLKRERMARTPEGHEAYKYTVTPKGIKRIDTNKAREAASEAAGKAVEVKAAKRAPGDAAAAKVKKADKVATVKVKKAAKLQSEAAALAGEAAIATNAAKVAVEVAEATGMPVDGNM